MCKVYELPKAKYMPELEYIEDEYITDEELIALMELVIEAYLEINEDVVDEL